MSARIKVECINWEAQRQGFGAPRSRVRLLLDGGRVSATERYFWTWEEAVEWAFRLTAPVVVPERSATRTATPMSAPTHWRASGAVSELPESIHGK